MFDPAAPGGLSVGTDASALAVPVPMAGEGDDSGGSQTLRAQLRLRELIVGGEFEPGARIPELALVDRLGVSRTPVRAALARLAE